MRLVVLEEQECKPNHQEPLLLHLLLRCVRLLPNEHPCEIQYGSLLQQGNDATGYLIGFGRHIQVRQLRFRSSNCRFRSNKSVCSATSNG